MSTGNRRHARVRTRGLIGAAVSAAAVVALVMAPAGSADAALAGADANLLRAPYLTDLTASGVTVSWVTGTQSKGIVKYGVAPNCTTTSVTNTKSGNPITVGTTTEYANAITLAGLSAGTSYCFRVYDGKAPFTDLLGTLPSGAFTTLAAPAGSGPVTFAVLGDFGDTTNSGVDDGSLNVNQANVLSRLASSGAQFAVTVGDVAYPGGTQTTYGDLNQTGIDVSAVFGPQYWAVPGAKLPVFMAGGNHGRNANLISVWPEANTAAASGGVYSMVNYPSYNGSAAASYPTSYYAFTVAGTRFYVLDATWSDSNVGTSTGGTCGSKCAMYEMDKLAHWQTGSAQYQWLAADLAAHAGERKLAFFHFPLRSDDNNQPGNIFAQNTAGNPASLEKLLGDNGVRLAFNGHSHTYQRFVPPVGGIASYVIGGGGAKLTTVGDKGCSTLNAYSTGWTYSGNAGRACGAAPVPTSDSQVFHFATVTINGSRATVTPMDATGRVFDVQTYELGPDTTAPVAPTVTATQPTSSTAQLSWSGASDAGGVVAYDVYKNGVLMTTVPPTTTTFSDSGLATGTVYTYRVDARDLAGNIGSGTVTVGSALPPPTVVFSDDFESGGLTNWTTVSGLAVDGVSPHGGSFTARESSTGTATYAYRTLPASTELWAQTWVRVNSRSTSANLIGFRTSGGGSILNLYLDSTGRVSLRNNVGAVTSNSTTTVTDSAWHRVVLHALVNGTSSSTSVTLDGVEVPGLTLTGQNLGTSAIARLQLGETATARTYDIALDDVLVSSTAI